MNAPEMHYTIKRTIIQCGAVDSIKYTHGSVSELNFFHDCNALDAQGIVADLEEEARRRHNDKHEHWVYELVSNEEPFVFAETLLRMP